MTVRSGTRKPIGAGTVVVVTGASAGVGRAVVRVLGSRGASVGLLARGPDGLEGARRDVEAAGGRALALSVDVADASAVEEAASRIESELGPIDVWINNAMVSVYSPVHEMTADEFRRVTEVTYLGAVHGTLSALRRMRQRDAGVIVQVGSALAYRSIPLQSAYCAAKHALRGFTESLRTELIHQRSGVEVTIVHLPALNTPQFGWVRSRLPRKAQPVPPIFQPEVAAEAIVWAAEHVPRELDVGAPTELAILAEKFAPGLMDRYLAKAAWNGQMYDGPADPDQPDNLMRPLPGDRGARGAFDARARDWSPHLWLATHPSVYRGFAVGLGLVAGIWEGTSRRPLIADETRSGAEGLVTPSEDRPAASSAAGPGPSPRPSGLARKMLDSSGGRSYAARHGEPSSSSVGDR
jgi:NAD(P)-dependent dehydrogenase (short-subunit alcohol dehydrogenase family)